MWQSCLCFAVLCSAHLLIDIHCNMQTSGTLPLFA